MDTPSTAKFESLVLLPTNNVTFHQNEVMGANPPEYSQLKRDKLLHSLVWNNISIPKLFLITGKYMHRGGYRGQSDLNSHEC